MIDGERRHREITNLNRSHRNEFPESAAWQTDLPGEPRSGVHHLARALAGINRDVVGGVGEQARVIEVGVREQDGIDCGAVDEKTRDLWQNALVKKGLPGFSANHSGVE